MEHSLFCGMMKSATEKFIISSYGYGYQSFHNTTQDKILISKVKAKTKFDNSQTPFYLLIHNILECQDFSMEHSLFCGMMKSATEKFII
jgi:hypothetical protein